MKKNYELLEQFQSTHSYGLCQEQPYKHMVSEYAMPLVIFPF